MGDYTFAHGLLAGLVVGFAAGIVLAALLFANRRGDDDDQPTIPG